MAEDTDHDLATFLTLTDLQTQERFAAQANAWLLASRSKYPKLRSSVDILREQRESQ